MFGIFKKCELVEGELYIDGLTLTQEDDLIRMMKLANIDHKCFIKFDKELGEDGLPRIGKELKIVVKVKKDIWNELIKLNSVYNFRKVGR